MVKYTLQGFRLFWDIVETDRHTRIWSIESATYHGTQTVTDVPHTAEKVSSIIGKRLRICWSSFCRVSSSVRDRIPRSVPSVTVRMGIYPCRISGRFFCMEEK